MGLELSERAFLVSAHKAAGACDIGGQDGCEPSLYALRGQRYPPANLPGAYHYAAGGGRKRSTLLRSRNAVAQASANPTASIKSRMVLVRTAR
jgi:hypothetical protein